MSLSRLGRSAPRGPSDLQLAVQIQQCIRFVKLVLKLTSGCLPCPQIDAVLQASPEDKVVEGLVVDCTGLYVMPGLCDAHVHCTACTADLPGLLSLPESLVTARAAKVLEGMLLRGFTTIRDAGEMG